MHSLDDGDALHHEIDASLYRLLQRYALEIADAAELIDAIRSMLGAGGKRLRPAFCYWGFRATGAFHSQEIVNASGSLELLHSFALIHDDVMDSASTRRGRPSINASNGDAFAILAGDLALVLADDAFMSSGFADGGIARAFTAYSRMRREVIAGQLLDIKAEARIPTIAETRRIALLKSGRYTVSEPLVIGCVLAGGPEAVQQQLSAIGDLAGEAFQLRDDVLGTFGSEAEIGKSIDSDIRQGKRHFLFAYAADTLEASERAAFLADWGRPDLGTEEIERLRGALERTGARAAAEDLIKQLHREAQRRLAEAEIDAEARSAIATLIDRAILREQ
ncbi:MAG: polyprenyl synthetase family protein [Actinomycetota bacterium]|nr:polyprenyl synthetase family protein [Actinomycetota bacterium]